MSTRDRTSMPAGLPVPAPLPSLQTAFSRRAALFGAVTATGFLAAAGTSALGQGSATTASPSALDPIDATLIACAGRTVALVRRLDRVLELRADAEDVIDRWNFANLPDEPVLPKARSRMEVTDLSTATHRIMQFSEPLDNDTQGETDLLAYKAAREAHKQAVADKLTQSRVPHLSKLFERTQKRLIRSVEQLTDMQPGSPAGLAAKASVIEALAETDSDTADDWGKNLGRSLAEDAMRLHAASVLS